MTNVGKVLGEAFGLVPFCPRPGLMQILSSIGSVATRMPLVDAGIGLIPGIAAMSHIVNNADLMR